MTAYYNEFDPKAAAWLRGLIKQGHIAPGDVDERSIEDVTAEDLEGYTQCHFFAGIGVWSYALRSAGWPDSRPVWTGSCPCQPFSAAGKGAGFADERHLWPAFFHLIRECRPDVVFGEQVASKDGLAWLDLVQSDLEGEGYSTGAVDTCAAGFGAPHTRQRLYWVGEGILANAESTRRGFLYAENNRKTDAQGNTFTNADDCASDGQGSNISGMADATMRGRQSEQNIRPAGLFGEMLQPGKIREQSSDMGAALGELADTNRSGLEGHRGFIKQHDAQGREEQAGLRSESSELVRPSPANGFWRDADWLFCRDGKWRPVEPSTFPLAHGAAARVGRLRGYGNAIVAQCAQAFIEAYLEVENG